MSDNNTASSYLRYLPPVLWAGTFPLMGQMLQVFEKILTGIDDGQVMQHGDHTHDAIEDVIARLDQLFDPWRTPPQFLDWLASCVDLTFPTLRNPQQGQIIQVWDEYLQRKAIAQIVPIYRKRGLKEGLNQYLNLYTLADKRPRIAVDDGSRVLFTHPQPGRFAPVTALISQGPYAISDSNNNKTLLLDGPVAPSCIALAPDGSMIMGDTGTPLSWPPPISSGLWRVLPSGQYMVDATTGKPQRISPATSFFGPRAVATDNATANWQIYMLDNVSGQGTGANALYQISSANFATASVLATKSQLGVVNPIAMAFTNGHLLILDRGSLSDVAALTSIIDVQLSPLVITAPHRINTAIEPQTLTVLSNGNLLIGDGRQQGAVQTADIVLIDRSNSASWVETSQLSTLSLDQNPLIAPVGVIRQDDTHLFVLDLGLKQFVSSQSTTTSVRAMAEAAAVYSIDLQLKKITRVTEQGALVHPTGMIQDAQGTLFIIDQGEREQRSTPRIWRAMPHEFGVVVHFSSQRSTTQQDRRQIQQNISDIVNQEKPAHSVWTMYNTTL